MKKQFFYISIIFGLIFVACKQQKKSSLQDYMVGNWETSYIKIIYSTYQKADSTFVFEDNFSKPNTGRAQSTYKKDGTFSAWFLQADKTKTGETQGTWKVKGDSLLVKYPYLGKQVEAWYFIKQTDTGFKGTVIYDWDNDGKQDDTLIMKTKRLP